MASYYIGDNNNYSVLEEVAQMLSMTNLQTLKKIAQKNMNSVQEIVDTVLGWFDKSISRYESMDTRYQGNFADAVAKLRDKRDAFAHFFGRASEGYYRSPISFDVTPYIDTII